MQARQAYFLVVILLYYFPNYIFNHELFISMWIYVKINSRLDDFDWQNSFTIARRCQKCYKCSCDITSSRLLMHYSSTAICIERFCIQRNEHRKNCTEKKTVTISFQIIGKKYRKTWNLGQHVILAGPVDRPKLRAVKMSFHAQKLLLYCLDWSHRPKFHVLQ